jgi:hypothetical protein
MIPNPDTAASIAALRSSGAAEGDIVGMVERITDDEISGWALSRSGRTVHIAVRVQGETLPANAVWIHRPDVSAAFGLGDWVVGFSIQTAELAGVAVARRRANRAAVEVLASGIPLPQASTLKRREAGARDFNIDDVALFTVRGWCRTSSGEPPDLEVRCNGQPLDCPVMYAARHDIPDAFGFDLDIPGYIWSQDAGEEYRCIEFASGGQVLHSQPLILARENVVGWITDVTRLPESPKRQYAMLSALEHVRYAGLLGELDEETQKLLRNFARWMRLEEFLYANVEPREKELSQRPEESAGTLIVWKALRALNARLLEKGGSVLPHVRAVLQTLRGASDAREHFLKATIALLCRSDEFAQMRELMDLSSLQSLEGQENLWALSVSLAALAADGHLTRVAEVMWRMPKELPNGWLNTECVRFAVVQTSRLEANGEANFMEAEKVRQAFIKLLDAMAGDWFSRLHDCQLVDALLEVLAHVDRYTDYHRRDIIRAAIRLYGLNPYFWTSWSSRQGYSRIPELRLAHEAWRTFASALDNRSLAPADRLQAILDGARFFRAYQNAEVPIFTREAVIQALPALNLTMSQAGRYLIEDLIDADWSEMLRIAAAPLGEANRLTAEIPQIEMRLLNVLREMSRPERSPFYAVQIEAAECLERCRQAAREAVEQLPERLIELESRACALTSWQGGYLAADLLASGYVLAIDAQVDGEALLMRLQAVIRKNLLETKQDWYFAAPVQAALARLHGLPMEPILAAFLHEIGEESSARFVEQPLPFVPAQPVLKMTAQGWPGDTLVVVYSCRKYLDSRVQAIRETWIADLQRRGVPYVVVVGDGDDTLSGDLLALNVSDRYEDLPKKTLKLLEWIYRNTDAQYVLKIDDDCYLDVDRYFDTLSYRKHFYYGRIIRRAVGGTNRVWHQPKSQSVHGRLGIDKSPDPSIYADGGGGYCLSRMAIRKLLDARESRAGRRLIACSFMEDKLVGDLLALSRINPSDEDYESYQRRKTFAEAVPVGMYDNTFFAGALSPTKVVHLDTERHLPFARSKATDKELWPKKIWPTCWAPALRGNSNQLELLSDAGKALELTEAAIIVVSVVRNEMLMLPHFLAHYRGMGVRCFAIVDNCSDDGSREYLLEQPDVIVYSADTDYKQSHYGVVWQQAILGNLCLGKWAVIADADELLVYEGCESRSLGEFVAALEAEDATGVRVDMVDMYPFGELAEADLSKQPPFEAAPWFDRKPVLPWLLSGGFYSNSTTVVSGLRHRLATVAAPHAFTSQKYPLLRYQPWVRLSQGLHDAAGLRVSAQPAWFAHFKYHAGFAEKVKTEVLRGQHFEGAEEYRRYAAMLRDGRGRFGKEGLSVKHEGSASFVQFVPHRKEHGG